MSSTPPAGPGDGSFPPPPSPPQPGHPGPQGYPDPQGYPGPPGYPGYPGQPQQAPLSTVAVLGLVFAVVFWPVGLVLSIIGIVQTKAGRMRGRGLAIAGLVVSGLFAVIGILVAVVAIAGLATSSGTAVSDAPSVTASPAPSPSSSGGQQPGVVPFGQTADDQGLAVTVAPPQPFTPSSTAVGGGEAQFVTVDITLENHRQAPVDPNLFYATASSGGHESTQVFDSAQDVGGPPSTAILPGDAVTFRIGFGVEDPSAVTVQVRPDFDSTPIIVTNRS